MTPRMWLRTFLAVKRGVDVSYDKDLERVLVETRDDLIKIELGVRFSKSIHEIINRLDETVDALKNRKLDPFNMEDKP